MCAAAEFPVPKLDRGAVCINGNQSREARYRARDSGLERLYFAEPCKITLRTETLNQLPTGTKNLIAFASIALGAMPSTPGRNDVGGDKGEQATGIILGSIAKQARVHRLR